MDIQKFLDMPFWQVSFFSNTVQDYGMALVLATVLFYGFKILQRVILKRFEKLAEKTDTDIDDAIIEIIHTVRPKFYSFVAFYIALRFLNLPSVFMQILDGILIIWVTYQVIAAAQIFISYVAKRALGTEDDDQGKSAIGMLSMVAKVVLWVLGILIILSNMGIDITSLIAGLGVGGIAVALALQNILADLFSSFSLYFDKPFKIGDFIVTGEHTGTVKKIGIKTTRLQSLTGEEIVIANQELTNARVQNFKKMERRRYVFTIGVTYETPQEKLKKIPEMIQKIVEKQENITFDRSHFASLGDSALLFETVYHVENSNYGEFMDVQEGINFGLVEEFAKEGIEFAYPTQTIHMTK